MSETNDQLAHILIVDDDPSIRDLLSAILFETYTCTMADSAEIALTYLEQESFDLVISDINMGGMSGIELISKAVVLSPDTVVMLISGNRTLDTAIEAIRGGAFDYIKKPFDIDQVTMSVDRAIAHARLLASKRRYENQLEQLVDERTSKLNYLAYHDSLTNLGNRAFFEDLLTHTLEGLSPYNRLSVLFVSLDKFEGLRDALGHSFGDQLLGQVADRFNAAAGSIAAVARFEGPEFGLILTNTPSEKLVDFAADIFGALGPSFVIGDREVFVSTSIGISQFPEDGRDSYTLLKNAGAALSEARRQGGNNHQFYTLEIHQAALKRLALENDLRRALERNEFEVFYQPKIDMVSRKIVGTEALVRWNHPELGLIAPADFIPVAEETGLIVPIGEWVIREACSQARSWNDKGHDLGVAINLSAYQLQKKDLADKVRSILLETGFDPKRLNLEVTESSIMNHPESAIRLLSELRNSGITIAVDDFGTGYSSLGYLKHLPIDVLKIDKSFVKDAASNADDAAIVIAIITLAQNLRLKVVAEGVETDEQLQFLHGLGCDEWQGYLFSKPLSADDLEILLNKPRPSEEIMVKAN